MSSLKTPSNQLNTFSYCYSFALFTDLTRVWTTSSERRYVSPVDQRRQEGLDGYLLSASDIVPVSGLCALLYGPQLCLLPKLYVGPDGGRGPQVYDPPCRLRLLSPARPQQLGTVSGGAPLECDGGHGAPGQACGGAAGRAAQSSWRLFAGQRHDFGRQERQAHVGGPIVERPQ